MTPSSWRRTTAPPGRSPRSARPPSATAALAKRRKRISLEDFTEALEQGKVETLNLILKGDVSGSVEALEDALLQIDVGDEVELRIIDRGVGAITQNNVNLAVASRRDHHRLQRPARAAGRRACRPRGRRRPLLLGDLPGDRRHRGGPQGHAQAGVRGGPARHRRGPRGLPVAASSATSPAAIVRSRARSAATPRRGCCATASSSADNLQIDSLRRFKDDVTEVREGFECGIGLGSYNDIKVDDVIETFELREKPRA